MKNTLFFDADFVPELLENEEAATDELRNAIFLHFTTSDALNQKLQIVVRAALFEVDLEPETEYSYQLAGIYWATGGTTSLRLVNDDGASEYTYINFPEILTVDAALQEEDVDNRLYYLQGKEDKTIEFRSETASYTNGREYNITTLQRFVQFVFASKVAQATGLLTLTLTLNCSGITDEATARFHIRVNLIMDEVFIPTQTVKNGSYIITICYPVENIAQSDRNSIDVYLEMSEGVGQILQGGAVATLTGSGVVGSTKFKGLIECYDISTGFGIPEQENTDEIEESIQIGSSVPVGGSFSETVPALAIQSPPLVDSLVDSARVVNYAPAAARLLEDEIDNRVTEDGDTRMTEEEHT